MSGRRRLESIEDHRTLQSHIIGQKYIGGANVEFGPAGKSEVNEPVSSNRYSKLFNEDLRHPNEENRQGLSPGQVRAKEIFDEYLHYNHLNEREYLSPKLGEQLTTATLLNFISLHRRSFDDHELKGFVSYWLNHHLEQGQITHVIDCCFIQNHLANRFDLNLHLDTSALIAAYLMASHPPHDILTKLHLVITQLKFKSSSREEMWAHFLPVGFPLNELVMAEFKHKNTARTILFLNRITPEMQEVLQLDVPKLIKMLKTLIAQQYLSGGPMVTEDDVKSFFDSLPKRLTVVEDKDIQASKEVIDARGFMPAQPLIAYDEMRQLTFYYMSQAAVGLESIADIKNMIMMEAGYFFTTGMAPLTEWQRVEIWQNYWQGVLERFINGRYAEENVINIGYQLIKQGLLLKGEVIVVAQQTLRETPAIITGLNKRCPDPEY
ncbi:MAG TPA: hypothetical protein VD999_04795 [Vitreimonas sp.]|nr:hypothetical protein [Vitreimonas sp.]